MPLLSGETLLFLTRGWFLHLKSITAIKTEPRRLVPDRSLGPRLPLPGCAPSLSPPIPSPLTEGQLAGATSHSHTATRAVSWKLSPASNTVPVKLSSQKTSIPQRTHFEGYADDRSDHFDLLCKPCSLWYPTIWHFIIQITWFPFFENGQHRKLEKMVKRTSSIISSLLTIAVRLSPIDCFSSLWSSCDYNVSSFL